MEDIFYTPSDYGYVYGLFASDKPLELRYIGQTRYEPVVRLRSHLTSNKGLLRAWIEDVHQRNATVGMRVLETCLLEMLSMNERKWIRHYKDSGLFNKDGKCSWSQSAKKYPVKSC